jgi:hypothetical protein
VKFHRPTPPHICGTNYQTGKFTVRRKTIGKRMAAKLKEMARQKKWWVDSGSGSLLTRPAAGYHYSANWATCTGGTFTR